MDDLLKTTTFLHTSGQTRPYEAEQYARAKKERKKRTLSRESDLFNTEKVGRDWWSKDNKTEEEKEENPQNARSFRRLRRKAAIWFPVAHRIY